MPSMIELDDGEWALVEDLFDPPGREGRPATYDRRLMVEAMLFLARRGCQWRYLPDPTRRGPPWQLWRRWRASGVWATAMLRIAEIIRRKEGRTATPSMVMIDGQTVRSGRAGPTFHEKGGRGGRTSGAKRSIAVEILGLPLAVSVESARPHDVSAGRRLLARALPELGTVQDVLADRGYRGLGKMAAKNGLGLQDQGPAEGVERLHPDLAALAPARGLAAAVALLRGERRERAGVAGGRRARLPVRAAAHRACLGESEVPERTELRPSRATAIMDRLRDRRLVNTVEEPHPDRRLKYVQLTEAGNSVCERLISLPGLAVQPAASFLAELTIALVREDLRARHGPA